MTCWMREIKEERYLSFIFFILSDNYCMTIIDQKLIQVKKKNYSKKKKKKKKKKKLKKWKKKKKKKKRVTLSSPRDMV